MGNGENVGGAALEPQPPQCYPVIGKKARREGKGGNFPVLRSGVSRGKVPAPAGEGRHTQPWVCPCETAEQPGQIRPYQLPKRKHESLRKQKVEWLQVSQQPGWWSHAFKILKKVIFNQEFYSQPKYWYDGWVKSEYFQPRELSEVFYLAHTIPQEAAETWVHPSRRNKSKEEETGDSAQQRGEGTPPV